MLRTRQEDRSWLETRLWIIDDDGRPILHGGASAWMANLEARPEIELVRDGETRAYRAVAIPGPHSRIDALLREKYGVADRWVRTVAPCDEQTRLVRLDPP